MISEREEYTFKNGGTVTLTNGEDGVTVELIGFDKPMMGTYNDIKKMTKDIGKFLMKKRPEIYQEDVFGSNVQEQDRELYKLAIRLRRINPKYTRINYNIWLWNREPHQRLL